jgi:uncharacterized RDD family membrane protein YckC
MKLFFTRLLLVACLVGVGPGFATLKAQDKAPKPDPAVQAPPPPTAPEVPTADSPDVTDDSPPEAAGTNQSRQGRDIVVTGSDVRIGPGETAGDIVVNGADVLVEGEVTGDIIVILGKVRILGRVDGDIINVGRGIWVENGGFVNGDVVGVGYGVVREPDGVVQGGVDNIGLVALPLSVRSRAVLFFEECVMMARPLSIRVGFVWVIWGVFLALQALLGLLFPGATRTTMCAMRERPGGTAILSIFGLPLLLLTASILTFTVIGTLAVPFLFAALVIGLCIGRIAILRLMGSRVLQLFGLVEAAPIAEFFTGALIATLLFLIPVVGLFTWMVFLLWALGAILMALFRRDRQPIPATPRSYPAATSGDLGNSTAFASTATATATVPSAQTPNLSPAMSEPIPLSSPVAASVGSSAAPDAATPPPTGPTGTASTLRWHEARQGPGLSAEDIASSPRPGLGRRLGALFIDWIPLMFLTAILPDRLLWIPLDQFSGVLRVGLGVAYFAVMLAWRGTTLGGLVLGLRVVRLDGRPIDRPVALVRALGAVLSGLCLGVGWFWASWDERRQTWHDRLAGTVVIRDDEAPPLV